MKQGCGKHLAVGEQAANVHGTVKCMACVEAAPPRMLTIYETGDLLAAAVCGEPAPQPRAE